VDVSNAHVEVVDFYVYLGSLVNYRRSSEPEIWRRVEITRSRISEHWEYLDTKLRLYRMYRPIMSNPLYGCETWSTTQSVWNRSLMPSPNPQTFFYLQRVTNEEVMRRTAAIPPAIRKSFVTPDCTTSVMSPIGQCGGPVPRNLSCSKHSSQPGTETFTWLRAVEEDLAPQHFGVYVAWRSAHSETRHLEPHRENGQAPSGCSPQK